METLWYRLTQFPRGKRPTIKIIFFKKSTTTSSGISEIRKISYATMVKIPFKNSCIWVSRPN